MTGITDNHYFVGKLSALKISYNFHRRKIIRKYTHIYSNVEQERGLSIIIEPNNLPYQYFCRYPKNAVLLLIKYVDRIRRLTGTA